MYLYHLYYLLFSFPPPSVAADRTIKTEAHEEYARSLSAGRHKIQHAWTDEEHPACQISGFLLVDRAPGNFHIQAQSKGHDLAAHMTNVSHIINHLSFGKPFSKYFIKEGLKNTPPGFLETTRPFDGNVYVTSNVHEAHHHYLKVITTDFDAEKNKKKAENKNFYKPQEPNRAYQILQSSQLSLYKADIVPGKLCVGMAISDMISVICSLLTYYTSLFISTEAKFTYDLSPIAVSYNKKSRAWYDYFTSVMAIVGGTFTGKSVLV